mmetsp:Transcript_7619/g.9399  ORF Transcript_7619/g.9399 Transcript_7619/m.9399 type:complete len:213 (-) Transcript_7619:394-1032(-)
MMSVSDHITRLLEKAEIAHQSTQRISISRSYEGDESKSVTTQSPSRTPYKEQFLLAQRALVSSREAAQMRYSKIENELLQMKEELETAKKELIQSEKLKFELVDIKLKLANVTADLERMVLTEKTTRKERDAIANELNRTKNEHNEKIQELSGENEILKKFVWKMRLERKQKEKEELLRRQHELEKKNVVTDDSSSGSDSEEEKSNSRVFWM